jgi:hypothetical protein
MKLPCVIIGINSSMQIAEYYRTILNKKEVSQAQDFYQLTIDLSNKKTLFTGFMANADML